MRSSKFLGRERQEWVPVSMDRDSNFELLRIIGMFFIVMHHYGSDELFYFYRPNENYIWFNEYWMKSLPTTGKYGVAIFLLITGYFQNGKPLRVSSIVGIWFQALSWSYIITFVWWVCNWDPLAVGWKQLFLPVCSHNWWFVTTYISMACLSGWTGAIVKYSTPAQLISGLITMLATMSFFQWDQYVAYSNVQWFVFVVVLGGTLRRFSDKLEFISRRALIILLAVSLVIVHFSVYKFLFKPTAWSSTHGGSNALVRENWSPMALVVGLLIFLIAQRSPRFVSASINRVSRLTLGVYLIHEHILIRTVLWREFIKPFNQWERVLFPVISLCQITALYTFCLFMEYCRQVLLNPVETVVSQSFEAAFYRLSDRINSSLETLNDKF